MKAKMTKINNLSRISRMIVIAGSLCAMTLPAQLSCAAKDAVTPRAQKKFESIDANGDGKVVIEEFRVAYPNMSEHAFVVIDKNNDKGIDQAEWYDFMEGHAKDSAGTRRRGVPMNNIPGDPLIPPVDSSDLPLAQPPGK